MSPQTRETRGEVSTQTPDVLLGRARVKISGQLNSEPTCQLRSRAFEYSVLPYVASGTPVVVLAGKGVGDIIESRNSL